MDFCASAMTFLYIDPGSGALLVQLALSAFFGMLFYAKRMMTWFRTKFARLVPGMTEPVDPSGDES